MSDTIDAAAPTPKAFGAENQRDLTVAANSSTACFNPRDLTRLAQGFSFIFWGSLAILSTIAETFGASTLQMYSSAIERSDPFSTLMLDVYSMTIGGAGVLGVLAGSWRLYQTKEMGCDWKNLTRSLLIVAMLVAYLFPFFCLWRRVPINLYLLCHALAWVGTLVCHLSLLSVAIGALAKLAGRSSLALQALLYGIVVFITLLTPFVLLAYALISSTRQGGNPLAAVQLLLESINPVYILMALLPCSLTLSLAWTAKDMALRRLTACDSEKADGSESA